MKQNNSNTEISRKNFLVGSVATLGATALSLSPTSAIAQTLLRAPVSVAYLLNGVLVPATSLALGAVGVSKIRVSIQQYGTRGSLKAVDAFALTGPAQSPLGFAAWSASSNSSRFVVPVGTNGVRLDIAGKSLNTLILRTGIASGPKLLAGTYVIVDGSVDWSKVTYDSTNAAAPFSFAGASDKHYLVVTIEPVASLIAQP